MSAPDLIEKMKDVLLCNKPVKAVKPSYLDTAERKKVRELHYDGRTSHGFGKERSSRTG